MKRCPQCNRVETDEALKFCRVDGATLINDSSSIGSEAGTADLSSTPNAGEVHTSILPHNTNANVNRLTGPTTALPGQPGPATKQLAGAGKRKGVLALAVAVILIVIAGGYFLAERFTASRKDKGIESVAVLPFENKSGNTDSEYLSDGLAESLVYRLSQLPNLKVSPTSSVMKYKGKATDFSQIAKELDVDAVMSGRVTQHGDDLTIGVELINVRTKKLIWAEQYERKMSDLLATQREIAGAIVQRLQVKLAGDNSKAITKHYTESNEAYQLYLKGRFYWQKRDEENLRKAIEQFKAAAEKDPNFALAFVGLSDSYILLPFYSNTQGSEVLPAAKAYAERALALDDSLGEAHASLAYVHRLLWNWAEMERELKRALELSPNYATAHKYYGNYLANFGRLDEALVEYKKAEELDSLSLIIKANLTEVYLTKGDTGAALEQSRQTIELDPNWYYIRQLSAISYLKQGRTAEAVADAEKSVELSKRQRSTLGYLGYIYAQTGKRDEALKLADELKQKFVKGEASGYDLARVYVGLGDKDQVFAWLEKDFQSHNSIMPGYLYIAPLDSLRDDPRFKDLTRRIGTAQ
jgi:TolB-like protein/Tfp pilus assembly protein PilF